jgi:NAD(P) transhydrogenase subunit alpha
MATTLTTAVPAVILGVPRERAPGERRVALVPDAVRHLTSRGVAVVVETGAGDGALIRDERFVAAGATIGDPWDADIVVKVAPPNSGEVERLAAGTVLVAFLDPRGSPDTAQQLRTGGVTAFAMESIPRISRAQAMDALSSQSTVAGYEAVLLAATNTTRLFPMLTTAAGTIPPAKVLVLGVGVAGLQALSTARRLGARTSGYDVRPEVAEQVRSVGATFLELGITAASDEGGYARELSAAQREQQQQALSAAIGRFDVVITTALVPGRPAPRMVTAQAVHGMRAGSVIVDLAGASGGNCELTEPGATVVVHDVTIVAPLDPASALPEHASQLYAGNVQALVELLLGADGTLSPDFTDEVVAGACITGSPVALNSKVLV